MNELAQIVKVNELDPQDGQIIIDRFGSYEQVANEWESKAKMIVVTSRDQTTEMAMAKEARKKFSQMRIDLEKARKSIGEPAFRKYKAVNAVAKYLQTLIQPIEDHLRLQEDFIKNDDARLEAERKIEEERRVEAERIAKEEAERKEQERIRLENEKLKKEAEEKEAQLQREREEARRKQEEIEKKAFEEKRKLEEKAQFEREEAEKEKRRLQEEQQKKLEAERKEREKVEAELQAKKDEEARIKKEAEEAERKRLEELRKEKEKSQKATDDVKYKTYIRALSQVEIPEVHNEEIKNKIIKIKLFLKKES